MKIYRLLSTPWMHTPNVIRWILSDVAPFDAEKATELLAAFGLPDEVVADLLSPLPEYELHYDGEEVIVSPKGAQQEKDSCMDCDSLAKDGYNDGPCDRHRTIEVGVES